MPSSDHHRQAILDGLAGKEPTALQIQHIRDHMPPAVVARGPQASSSDNWSRTAAGAALVFAHRQSMRSTAAEQLFGFEPWAWWQMVLAQDLDERGLMGKEGGTLVYDVEHALPAYLVFALTDGALKDLARRWLKGWLAIRVLSAVPVVEGGARAAWASPPPFTSAHGAGLRSFSRSPVDGGFRGGPPHHVWLHPAACFVASLLGYPAKSWPGAWPEAVGDALGWPMVLSPGEHAEASNAIVGEGGSSAIVADWLPRMGPELHIIRWQVQAATVMTSPRGWDGKSRASSATAPVYACVVRPDGEREILTADGGQRDPVSISLGGARIRDGWIECWRRHGPGDFDYRWSMPGGGRIEIPPLADALWHYVLDSRGARPYAEGTPGPPTPDPSEARWRAAEKATLALAARVSDRDDYKTQSRIIDLARIMGMGEPTRRTE